MKIASITVTSNREDIIVDAIRSVKDWIDAAIIVDLGITDKTADIVKELMGPDRVHVVKCDGVSTSDWRNAGMDEATRLGFDWCVTLDTDERIHLGNTDIRGTLAGTEANIILCDDVSRNYNKERFFRLPCAHRWVGHCHEHMEGESKVLVGILGTVTFEELPKSKEQMDRKCEFIVEEMLKEIAETPERSRCWYQLGDAYVQLDKREEAIKAFIRAAELTKSDCEGAWGCLRAAAELDYLGRPQEALDWCCNGLKYHPGYAELSWLAGVMCLKMQRWLHAIMFANMAIANGKYKGGGNLVPRPFYSLPIGLWEGPYEVLHVGYANIGLAKEAAKALKEIPKAKSAYEKSKGGSPSTRDLRVERRAAQRERV